MIEIYLSDDEKIFEPPVNWDDQGTENVKIVSLLPSSTEYTIVEQKFLQSLFSGRQEWVAMLNRRTFRVTKVFEVLLIHMNTHIYFFYIYLSNYTLCVNCYVRLV